MTVSASQGSSARSLAVFIDADNLNEPTALDHVLTQVRTLADRVVYRRAYGRPESLRAIEAVLWRHGVRPVANMIVDKTTTDSALVIDAVAAVCRNEIEIVVICSGDADFVPLATWLREHSCRVLCFSLANKIFGNAESFYDEVTLLDVVSPAVELVATQVPSEEKLCSQLPLAPKAPQAIALPVAQKIAESKPAKSHGVSTAAVPKSSSPAKKVASVPAPSVKALLKAVPGLAGQEAVHLSIAAKKLREAGLISKTASSTAVFRRYPAQFELRPPQQPNTVRYRG